MATDTRATGTPKRPRSRLTLADLCQAIEGGTLSVERQGDAYEFSGLDLRRMRRRIGAGAPLVPRLVARDDGNAPHDML